MKEFDFINLLKCVTTPLPEGIGDDAALYSNLLFTTDAVVEGVHFLPDEDIKAVVHRFVHSNLSDVAAMGGKPPYRALLTAAIPLGFNKKLLAKVLTEELCKMEIKLIGGDTVTSKSGLMLSLTLIGARGKNLLTRAGAKPGDLVYLSRVTGQAKYALNMRLSGDINNQVELNAETELGALLGEHGVSACIDISDGLGQDLSHIANASKVQIVIDTLPLPNIPLPNNDKVNYALTSGEEYALAFTAPSTFNLDDLQYSGVRPHLIGQVLSGDGCFYKSGDKLIDISNFGYTHR